MINDISIRNELFFKIKYDKGLDLQILNYLMYFNQNFIVNIKIISKRNKFSMSDLN